MSKKTDDLRWEIENRMKGYYETEEDFLDVLERTVDEVDEYMMELPLDADDVPIRVGDVVCHLTYGDGCEVLGVGDGDFLAMNGEGEIRMRSASMYSHRKRTLEDILRDLQKDTLTAQGEYAGEVMDADEFMSELGLLVDQAAEEIRGGCMGRDEMVRVLRRMVDTLPDVETDICTEIGRAVDEIAGKMW